MVFSALTIAGSDSGGGAGIQADLKTFAAHRVHGLCVITSLTAQNTLAVRRVSDVPVDFIRSQFDAVHEDFTVGAAKTGMLSTKKIIKAVAESLQDHPLVVDPVMVSESKGRLLDEDAVETLKEMLLPKAWITTPNIYEAEILSDMRIKGLEDIKEACRRISKFGCDIVIKGGHLDAVDVLYVQGAFHTFRAEKLKDRFHGSGCTYSAAITANLALGYDVLSSVANAKSFIKGALKTAFPLGRGGLKLVNQLRVPFEEKTDKVSLALRRGVMELEGLQGLYRVAPEVGMNLCYAKAHAKSPGDVMGVTGRIIRVGDEIRAVGGIEKGASKHMARVVLAAMEFDQEMRAALNIKYRPELMERIEKKAGLAISSFDRKMEPDQKSTMEWGTKDSIERFGRVPDLIFDQGGLGKEPMIRILGRNPSDVISKLKKVLEAADGL